MGLGQFWKNIRTLGTAKLEDTEQRADQVYSLLNNEYGHFLNNIATSNIDYGLGYTPAAMRVSTVFTCVLVRAESLSSLPASVMQWTANGSVLAPNQAAHYLIHNRPNPFQTACDFWKMVSAQIDLCGNSFGLIRYSGRYQPTRIDLIEDPHAVEILETEGGNAVYDYDGKRYQSYEILHFKDLSIDGFRGVSKIKYNADLISYSKKLKAYGSNAIGTKPPGYFTTEATFDTVKKQEDNLAKGWSDNIAGGKTPVLPFGLKYMNLQISPGDAQYLEAVDATKEDIYGIFRVPPTLAQNYERATFANAEQQDLVFVKYTMLPLITNIEQECNSKLFSEANAKSETPYYVKFNVNAFMRGDFKTRTEGYKTLVQNGLISINQVADLEDWAKVDGGDERYIPMNLISLSKYNEFIDKMTAEPQATNAGSEGGSDNAARSLKELLKNGTPVNGHAN